MTTDYNTHVQDIAKSLGTFNKSAPDVMKAFSTLGQAATKEGTLSTKHKELIALGIAVATQCESCVAFHMQKLVKLNVTLEEVVESLSMAVYMGGGPAVMYAAKAIQAFEQFSS